MKASDWPVAMLALMMFLLPALGVPSELMLQDTLKSAIAAFGVLTAALLFFWQQRHRTEPLLWHGMVWLPLVLMLYALGSMAWSHTYLAGVEAIRWFVLSLLLWLGLNTLTRQNLPLLLWGIHAGTVVASLWLVLQFWFDLGWFTQGAPPSSTFVNRNFFAEYAVSVLPLSVYLLASQRASRWLGLLALSLALIVVALLMTGTRSALLAWLLLLPVLALILVRYRQQFTFAGWSRRNQALVSLVLAGAVLGLGSMPTDNAKIISLKTGSTALNRSFLRVTSMSDAAEFSDGSFSIRAAMWKSTARMMLANPWSGVGAGAWEVQIPLYQPRGFGMELDFYAHNEFLQLLSEYGVLVGGLFIAVLLAYLLISAGKTWRLPSCDATEAPLRASVLASVLALLIVSNAGFPWRLASTGALMALSLSILLVSDARLGFRETFFSASLRWRPAASRASLAGLMVCFGLAGYITQQAAMAEWKIVSAVKLAFQVAQPMQKNTYLLNEQKARVLQYIRDGIAINPHYRKLTPSVASLLAASGDWSNAIWVWESLASSRPHIAEFWSHIARGYTQLGQYDRAMRAVAQWQRLDPDAPGSTALEVSLLNKIGHSSQALQRLTDAYKRGQYDITLLMAGYAIGLETHNWPLAIQSLELRNKTWPDQATDGFLRLGKIYADPLLADETRALAAFRAGLAAVPADQKDNFKRQVPANYRTYL